MAQPGVRKKSRLVGNHAHSSAKLVLSQGIRKKNMAEGKRPI